MSKTKGVGCGHASMLQTRDLRKYSRKVRTVSVILGARVADDDYGYDS